MQESNLLPRPTSHSDDFKFLPYGLIDGPTLSHIHMPSMLELNHNVGPFFFPTIEMSQEEVQRRLVETLVAQHKHEFSKLTMSCIICDKYRRLDSRYIESLKRLNEIVDAQTDALRGFKPGKLTENDHLISLRRQIEASIVNGYTSTCQRIYGGRPKISLIDRINVSLISNFVSDKS